jgi:hypothetical protein
MKKLLLLALLCAAGTVKSYGQIGLQVSYVAPTGGEQYILKRTVGVEVVANAVTDLDERLSVLGSIGIYYYRPTADTFRTISIHNSTIIPSTQAVNYAMAFPITLALEYRFLKTPLSPMVGAEASFYVVEWSDASQTAQSVELSPSSETYWTTGVAPRAGVSYLVNEDLLITAGVVRTYGIIGTMAPQLYFRTFVRAIHSF